MAEIVNTKPREKRKLVPYIEMGGLAICSIKNCHKKNGAVIKINDFPLCKACEGRKLTPTAREMRKHPFHTVLRKLLHDLSLPQMPLFCHVPAFCSAAVPSPSSSIKLSHVFLWSAVHSLSHHCTLSLPASCWNSTLRQPLGSLFSCLLVSQIPGTRHVACLTAASLSTRSMCCSLRLTQTPPSRGICAHILKKVWNVVWSSYWRNNHVPDSQQGNVKIVLVSILLAKRSHNFLLSTWIYNQVV